MEGAKMEEKFSARKEHIVGENDGLIVENKGNELRTFLDGIRKETQAVVSSSFHSEIRKKNLSLSTKLQNSQACGRIWQVFDTCSCRSCFRSCSNGTEDICKN